jgi:hypothetical protein
VIDTWWRDVHAPDMLAVPGVLAALRFRSLLHDGRSLVLFLLDEDPAGVLARVPEHRARWQAAGRTPSPGGASKALFNGPYRSLAPLGAVDGWCGASTESTTTISAS